MYDYIIEKPELNEDTLAHFGIKGMKWRNRKSKITSYPYQKKFQQEEQMKRNKKRARRINRFGDLKDKGFADSRSDLKVLFSTKNGFSTKYDTPGLRVGAGLRAGRQRKAEKDAREIAINRGIEAGRERVKKRKK